MAANKKITGAFSTEKPTKNTVKFAENGAEASFVMGTAYVQKSALAKIGNPDKVKITVEAAA